MRSTFMKHSKAELIANLIMIMLIFLMIFVVFPRLFAYFTEQKAINYESDQQKAAIAILNHFLKITVLMNFRKIKFMIINTKFK
jgi:hypothetical protein